MTGSRRLVPVTVMVSAASALFLVGCTSSSTQGGDGGASCARRVAFGERVYSDVANVEFTVGGKLGEGQSLTCDDTGGRGEQQDSTKESGETNVYKVRGLSRRVAVAVGDTRDSADFFASYDGKELPAPVRTFIDKQ